MPPGTVVKDVEKKKIVRKKPTGTDPTLSKDYSTAVKNLGLAYFSLRDAIREGDGHRVDVYYRVFLLHAFRLHHTNYALECAHRHAQILCSLI